MFRSKNEKGFTLIELLVILSIIAFMAAAAMLVLSQSRSKSRNATRVADINSIRKSLDLFYLNCGAYPINTTALTITSSYSLYTGTGASCGTKTGSSSVNGGFGTVANGAGNILIKQLKSAPMPADGSCSAAENDYTYSSPADGSTYSLTFCLGAQTGDFASGVRTATDRGIQ